MNVKNMDKKTAEGYICGMIFSEESGKIKIIDDANVTSDTLNAQMLFDGFYFVSGQLGFHKINVSAVNYDSVELEVRITSYLQERNIYLYNVSQMV